MDPKFMKQLSQLITDTVRKAVDEVVPEVVAREIGKYSITNSNQQTVVNQAPKVTNKEPTDHSEIPSDFKSTERIFDSFTKYGSAEGFFSSFKDSEEPIARPSGVSEQKKMADILDAGKEFYDKFAKRSALHGKEFGGHLYSPYYFYNVPYRVDKFKGSFPEIRQVKVPIPSELDR